MKRTIYSQHRYLWQEHYDLDSWEYPSLNKGVDTFPEKKLIRSTTTIFMIIILAGILGLIYTLIWIFPFIQEMIMQAISLDYSASIMQVTGK